MSTSRWPNLDRTLGFYRDRPEADWPRTPAGELAMTTEPLDVAALLAEATG